MISHGNPKIAFRAPLKMHARLIELANSQRLDPSDWVKSQIFRLLNETSAKEKSVEARLDALQDAVAELAKTLREAASHRLEIEKLCASSIAASALLLDAGTGSAAQAQERIKGHVRSSLAASQAVLSLRAAGAAEPGREPN